MALEAFVQQASPASFASSANVLDITASVGTASAARLVVLCVGTELTSGSINSATINGAAMNAGQQANLGACFTQIFYATASTGTTAIFRVTLGATAAANTSKLAIYTCAPAAGQQVVLDTAGSASDTDADPMTATAIVAAGGNGICVAVKASASACTWGGFAENLDVTVTGFQFSVAIVATATTANLSVSGGNLDDGCLSWLTFKEQAPFSRNHTMVMVLGY